VLFFYGNTPICKAPFVGIFIDTSGNVTPCCFNREDIFGNIYTQSIKEIWYSEIALNLRNTLLKKILPKGCIRCQEFINAKNFYNSGIYIYKNFNHKKLTIQTIDLELSYLCNLNCEMCYLKSKKYELSQEKEEIILKCMELLLPNLKRIRFLGGEPLYIPIYKKIFNKILTKKNKYSIHITTNGTIFEKSLKKISQKNNLFLTFSIDSLDEYNYKKIRRGAQLQNVINNIKAYKQLKPKHITIAITPMILNVLDIPKLVKYANNNNFSLHFNYLIYPKELSINNLNIKDLKKIIEILKKNSFIPKNFRQFFNYLKYYGFINQVKYALKEKYKKPNYSNNEVNYYALLIYNFATKKLNNITNNFNKEIIEQIIKQKLKELYFHEILNYLNETNTSKIIDLIEKELKKTF